MERTKISGIKISIWDLMPHPDNPRKNVGDVSELAESIKKNGIMQNLTVMPEECLTKEPEEQPNIKKESSKKYYVLIGHRRLEAAKKAGLSEVPCTVISNISKKQQVGIMLEENMQRHDLTVWEQASGFQMMLDLGSSVDEIVEKTGFARSTVYHRLNIAKLDKDVVEEKEKDKDFQLSIKSLIALEQIKDVEKRNELLEMSDNIAELNISIEDAVEEQQMDENRENVLPILKELGIETYKGNNFYSWNNSFEVVEEIDLREEFSSEDFDIDCQEKLYYKEGSCCIYIFYKKKQEKRKKTKEELEREEKNKRIKQLKELYSEMVKKRKRQIKDIVVNKTNKRPDDIILVKELWSVLKEYCAYLQYGHYGAMVTGKSTWELTEEEKEWPEDLSINEEMLVEIANLEACPIDYYGRFDIEKANKERKLYDALANYGIKLTEEERQIITGTHELYNEED
ncbi:MAG: ParB/RepB/Spo0J family partition protein [Eubacterium sp.]|nr:ParB/RepB/Spo0J family partition protein [Eubacterium sp.]